MNPLPQAADAGNLNDVVELLRIGSATQADRDLSLGRACCSGHFRIAEVLLEHGADPNGQYETAPGEFEYGPILLASCEFLNPEGVEWLLQHGADPNGNPAGSQHNQCCTPLEMVRDSYVDHDVNRSRCTELLIAAGAVANGESSAQS